MKPADCARGTVVQVTDAYNLEAQLLDEWNLSEWLRWVDDGFRYEVPIPVTRDDPRESQYSEEGFFSVETRDSIALWVSRLSPALVDAAYGENPPVRTRHFVTNVRVDTHDRGLLKVRSNVLLTWGKWNEAMRMISGERQDTIRDHGDGDLRLMHRRVLIDTNVIRLGHFRVII